MAKRVFFSFFFFLKTFLKGSLRFFSFFSSSQTHVGNRFFGGMLNRGMRNRVS